jgi:haloacetate dehalogenase
LGKKRFHCSSIRSIALWQQRANQVTGQAIASGHFLPEEAPEETAQEIEDFLG